MEKNREDNKGKSFLDTIFDAVKKINLSETIDEFRAILKTTDYKFCNFRAEILKLINHCKRAGNLDLVCAQIQITDRGKTEYNATISVYFRDKNGNPAGVQRQCEIHDFDYIPKSVSEGLKSKGNESIIFYLEDLNEFATNYDLEVQTANKPFKELVQKTALSNGLRKGDAIVLSINNFVLYYRTKLFKVESDGTANYICDFLTSHLNGLRDEEETMMAKNNELTIKIQL